MPSHNVKPKLLEVALNEKILQKYYKFGQNIVFLFREAYRLVRLVEAMNERSHFLTADSVVWLRHPVALLQTLHETERISTRIGSLPSTEYLPHCHPIRPLLVENCL